MPLKRTTVYADVDDLAVIKEAAKALGSSEAEIIRLAIHRAALAHRRWEEPMNAPRFSSGDPTLANRVTEVLSEDFGGQPR